LKENIRNGFGKYVLSNGSVYNGMWREGMMNGRGVFMWPDHSVYDGEWKDGKRYVKNRIVKVIVLVHSGYSHTFLHSIFLFSIHIIYV
jgi:predicted acyl esterase